MNLHEELAAKDALITAQVVRIAELERENARLDAALDGEISCRDHYHEWADKLAAEISRYFGVDIGEHSNANNPWEQAYEAVPAAPAVEQPIGHISKGMLEQLRERLGVSGYVQSGRTEEFPVALYTAPQAAEADKVREALKTLTDASEIFMAGGVVGLRSAIDNARLVLSMAAQAPVREVPGWQPIETAPKDEHIIGYWRGYKRPCVMWWNFKDSAFESWSDRDETPSHWMPLPAAPVQQEG